MTNNATPDTEQQGNAASTATSSAVPETSTPAKKNAAKSSSKSSAKSTVKPAAKPPANSAPKANDDMAAKAASAKPTAKAPTKASAKPAGIPVAEQEAAKKGEAAKTDKIAKPRKAKLVRDGFTMPESEYDLLAAVKKRCLVNGLSVKKSEVLRAAIISFAAQSDAAVTVALQALDAIKTGRPPKGQK